MKVRTLTILVVAIAAIAGICKSAAAELPSRDTLSAMGLEGLVVMDDEAGLSVRGQGYKSRSSAKAWGSSFAAIAGHGGIAASQNGYEAQGKHVAGGENYSEAGLLIVTSKGKGGKGGHGGGPTSMSGKKGRNGGGHNNGGHGGGKPSVKFVKVFAGGSSRAYGK